MQYIQISVTTGIPALVMSKGKSVVAIVQYQLGIEIETRFKKNAI